MPHHAKHAMPPKSNSRSNNVRWEAATVPEMQLLGCNNFVTRSREPGGACELATFSWGVQEWRHGAGRVMITCYIWEVGYLNDRFVTNIWNSFREHLRLDTWLHSCNLIDCPYSALELPNIADSQNIITIL